MKPIDLQVNIMKSLDLIQEKGKESFQNALLQQRGEELKEERLVRDFQIVEGHDSDRIRDRNKKRGEGRNQKPQDEQDEVNLSGEADQEHLVQNWQNHPSDEDPIKGHNIDFTG